MEKSEVHQSRYTNYIWSPLLYSELTGSSVFYLLLMYTPERIYIPLGDLLIKHICFSKNFRGLNKNIIFKKKQNHPGKTIGEGKQHVWARISEIESLLGYGRMHSTSRGYKEAHINVCGVEYYIISILYIMHMHDIYIYIYIAPETNSLVTKLVISTPETNSLVQNW